VPLRQRQRQRPARAFDDPTDHAEFRQHVGLVEIRDHLEDAGAGILHALRDADEFGFGGAQRRRRIAFDRLVVQRARGGEPECSGAHGIGGQLAHLRDVVVGRGFKLGTALTHHIDAQGAMRQLGGDVDVVRPGFHRVEIFGEAFPVPFKSFVQRGTRNVFDAFHQLDQPLAILDAHRREADAAIAHHDRGHAMPARWIEPGVPRRLPVIVGVDIDKARRDELALGIDLFATAADNLADCGDLAVLHRDVGGDERPAHAVGDASIADDEIEFGCHGVLLFLSLFFCANGCL